MTEPLPTVGVAKRSMRLTYPARWRSERAALLFARDNQLERAGIAAVLVDGEWRLVIDSCRAPMLAPWLRQQFPGIVWGAGWTP